MNTQMYAFALRNTIVNHTRGCVVKILYPTLPRFQSKMAIVWDRSIGRNAKIMKIAVQRIDKLQGSHKNLIIKFHDFSMTIYAIFHDARKANTENNRTYASHTRKESQISFQTENKQSKMVCLPRYGIIGTSRV